MDSSSPDPGGSCLELPAQLDSVPAFQEFALACARSCNLSDEAFLSRLELVLEEVLLNVVNYAYVGGDSGPVKLSCAPVDDGSVFRISVQDTGQEFNPLETKEPDVEAGLMERPIGGLGIFLVKRLADKAAYERIGGTNLLTLDFRA